jgi:hypothetical protein
LEVVKMDKNFDEFVELLNTEQNMKRRSEIIINAINEFKGEDDRIDVTNGDAMLAIVAAMQDFTFDAIRQYHEWLSSNC